FALGPLRRILFDLEWSDQSPLYFLLLHLWSALGQNSFAVRTMNLAVVTVLVCLLSATAQTAFHSRRVAVTVALLAVVSPLSFWLVRNGRMYGLEVLFSTAALYATLRHVEERTWKTAIAVAVACAIGVYNHFFGLVVTGIVAAFLLLEVVLEVIEQRGTVHL